MYEEYYAPLPDAEAYLSRMNFLGKIEITPQCLSALVRAHHMSVPFENYDICELDRPADIAVQALFDKIVTRRRGGYCFELNGLFYSLLIALGFDAKPALCRIVNDFASVYAPLHRCNLVLFGDKTYFTDVGFGGPMPSGAVLIEEGFEQTFYGMTFKCTALDEHQWCLCRKEPDGSWARSIIFSKYPSEIVDFLAPNFFCSCQPTSPFKFMRSANLYLDNGFRSISEGIFTNTENGNSTKTEIKSKTQEFEILKEYFGIELV